MFSPVGVVRLILPTDDMGLGGSGNPPNPPCILVLVRKNHFT